MKLLLLTVLCFAAAIAAPAQKQKRDILPGDPRYGTDYHHQHHHAHQDHHENEVEVARSSGGYVGSYSVPTSHGQANSYQVPQTSYGPPNHRPGKPLSTADYLPPVVEVAKQPLATPAPSYGAPSVHVPQHAQVVEVAKTPVHVPAPSYGAPAQIPQHVPVVEVAKTQAPAPAPTPSYAAPVPSYAAPAVQEVQQHAHVPATSYGPPATSYGTPVASVQSAVHSEKVSNEYGAPVVESVSKTVESPVSSYGTPVVDVQAQEHVESVDTSYGVPAVQEQVDAGSHVETSHVHAAVEKVAVPEVQVAPVVHEQHTHVEQSHVVQQPQVKVAQQHHAQQANGGYAYNQANHGSFSSGYEHSHVSVPQVPSYVVPQVHHHVQQQVRTSPAYEHVQVQKQIQLPAFIQNLPNFQLPSFIQDTFSNFQLPQLPSLPSFGGNVVSTPVEIPTSVPADAQVVQTVRSSGVQQQYASNGGYVY